jgi:hypothetical protein
VRGVLGRGWAGPVSGDDEGEVVHHWHCNPDRAVCGVDLSDGEDRDGAAAAAAGEMCVVCVDLIRQPCDITCPLVVFT